nr:retrovirus-related Pol polyprotein from transposon TNT 1-94 [Tanacetum cinerariifolium]
MVYDKVGKLPSISVDLTSSNCARHVLTNARLAVEAFDGMGHSGMWHSEIQNALFQQESGALGLADAIVDLLLNAPDICMQTIGWSSIFADRSDKGFLVRVDQERIVKRVPTSSHRKWKKMKLFQGMHLIQKLRHDQKRMKKVFEVMLGGYVQKSNQDWVREHCNQFTCDAILEGDC